MGRYHVYEWKVTVLSKCQNCKNKCGDTLNHTFNAIPNMASVEFSAEPDMLTLRRK